jgi:NAD(P)-dependent dehydrogenase (short-subunit alcohol dehydrogenase family)
MTILITGGVSGAGRAITEVLAEDKSINLIVTYNKSVEEAKQLCSEYKNVQSVKCNFQDDNDLKLLLEFMEDKDIDVLINNASLGIKKEHFFKTEPEYFIKSFSANVVSTIKITQKAISVFRKKNFGKIITILSSSIINKPPIGWSIYVAEKSYLFSLAKSWAIENAKFNITSNMVSPSFMRTSLNKDVDERILEDMRLKLPLKKFLTPEELAESVKFLVYCNQQINGNNIIINQAEDLL